MVPHCYHVPGCRQKLPLVTPRPVSRTVWGELGFVGLFGKCSLLTQPLCPLGHHFRVGVPAAGDGIPGHFPVPLLDPLSAAQGDTHIPDRPVGFPVVDLQNHAWSSKYNFHCYIWGETVLKRSRLPHCPCHLSAMFSGLS